MGRRVRLGQAQIIFRMKISDEKIPKEMNGKLSGGKALDYVKINQFRDSRWQAPWSKTRRPSIILLAYWMQRDPSAKPPTWDGPFSAESTPDRSDSTLVG